MQQDKKQRNRKDTSHTGGAQHTPGELAEVFGEVRTERLVLRRPDAGDGEAMFRVHGDPATYRYNPAGADPDLATSVAVLEEWLRLWERDGYGYWAIVPVDAKEVCGFGGVRHIAWHGRDVLNLYYRLTPGAWGRGYATETAREAVRLARAYLPHLPVVARVRAANVPSIRTAERAGLARRVDLDDAEHLVYAVGSPDGS